MSSLLQEVKVLLAELGHYPKRSLGQNFLVNEQVIEKILHRAKSLAPRTLVEIGPGLGALTKGLGRDFRGRFLLMEMDKRFCEHWRSEGFEVHEGDALRLDWNELGLEPPALLVSNLPYQISSTLVIDRCLGPDSVQFMLLMFQKEVAQRIVARPHSRDYGLLSVMAQVFWKIDFVLEAGPRDFYPAPQVASRVLKFCRVGTGLGAWSAQDRQGFLSFLKTTFAQRRKLLLNNLKQVPRRTNWEALLAEMNIDIKARAENLTPSQFVSLYQRYLGKI